MSEVAKRVRARIGSFPSLLVDRRIVGDGRIGPITQRLSQRFEAVVRGRLAARMDWLTPVW
ncbi:MAG TPA: hypothetical protein VN894_14625 [Polyangiaceae bacterium]|nr:hypothetical protein [Polyangiaceae bacterium]